MPNLHAIIGLYSAGGGYINMMMSEGDKEGQAAYRENYPRLARIKAKYDPTNVFHINQNIRPARGTSD